MSESILDKAKSMADSLKEKVSGLSDIMLDNDKDEIIKQFKEKGESKIDDIFTTIDQYRNVFSDAGYEVGGMNISLGLPPDITIIFKFLGTVDSEKRNELEAKVDQNRLAAIILGSLFKASDFSEKIKVGELKLKTINIKLGLIPSISVALG